MNVSSLTPIDSSKSTPTRRNTSMSCGCVLSPAPRPVRSSGLRSNTRASQPALRRRCAANSPPSEPPITRARRAAITGIAMRGSCHGPRDAVVAGPVVAVRLRRISVHQRPAIERMSLAAHLVLHGEQHLTRVEIDNVLEPILVLVHLHGEETELFQPPIGAGEITDVDLSVVPIVGFFRRTGLAEVPVLSLANLHAGFANVCSVDARERAHDLTIETRDALCRTRAHVERDVRHAQHDAPETALIRRVHVDAVTPRTDGLDAVVAFAEIKLGSFQRLAQLG